MDLATVIWVVGAAMAIGALGYALSGPILAVGGVGFLLFVVGLATDLLGGK